MSRKANEQRIQDAARLVHNRPGKRSAEYAREMGCARETFNRLLVRMNDRGILLSEDREGRLWPFRDSPSK